jgi:ERCC4-type nuclease
MRATPIEVDYREDLTTAVGLVDRLGADQVVPRSSLTFGDLFYATEECSYGVELKSVSDFFGSLWSKESGERLEWQLQGLRECVDVPLLGIHGILFSRCGVTFDIWDEMSLQTIKSPYKQTALVSKEIKETGMRVPSVEGFLASIVLQGVCVIYRPTKDGLLDALTAMYKESSKDAKTTFNHHLHRGTHTSATPGRARFLNNLCSITGLGEVVADRLLERFTTPWGVYSATDKELMGVHGVGREMVKRIREGVGNAG